MRLRASVLLPILCLPPLAVLGAETGSLADRYQRSLQELDQSRQNEDKTRAERDAIVAEAKRLQEQLVVNAARVQEIEESYAATAVALELLNQKLHALETDLNKDRSRVAQLLSVLQRLDADTPPALALRPDDSLAAARGAMQLGALLPPVYAQAAELAKRLKELEETRNAQAAKVAEGAAQADALRSARVDLDQLLQLHNQEEAKAAEKLAQLHGITEEIAKASVDMRGLIERIAALRAEGGSSPGMRVVTPVSGSGAGLARSSLRVPVVGKIEPGDSAGPGSSRSGTAQGLWIEAAEGAEAVAPSDSEVVFAGPYQKFGQVLILEIIGGYHLTLAGLGRIDVRIGDRVLAGEPVGILPQGSPARLFMELRHNGQVLDPAPWMSAELRKAKGT